MRLVLVAHAYPRWAGDVAGSFLARLAEALVARNHTVAVVAPADRGRGARRVAGGVDVVQVRYAAPERETLAYTGDMADQARTTSGALAFLRLVRALRVAARAEVERLDADLVHAFWWIPAGWAATGAPVPVVVSLMGTDVALMRSLPARLLARRVLKRAAGVTALSTFLAREARRRTWLRDLEIERVPVPADPDRFRHRSAGGGGVVYLGRLSRQKRVDLLLDAVHHAGITAPVTIVGDGPARPDLERQVAALGLHNVRFRGALPNEEVVTAIGDADVAVFPSRHEGLGLAAAEALMLGIPVVATADGGGVLDLVRDGEGARVAAPTAAAVGSAVQACLTHPAMRAAAVRAGDALRAELSPATVAQRFENVYAHVA